MSGTDGRAQPTERMHGLDSLRGAMMLLGIVLHGGISYAHHQVPFWPYQDQSTHPIFDAGFAYIHIFRMPLFFVLAGFFGALLLERRGTRAFAGNRFRRIVLPLVFGWLIAMPFMGAASYYAAFVHDPAFAQSGEFRGNPKFILMHFWFLYFLTIFCGAVLPATFICSRIPDCVKAHGSRLFRRALESPWRPLLFAAPTSVLLFLMPLGLLETDASLSPHPRVLAAYGLFFGFGWLLYAHRDLLATFPRGARRQILLTLPLFGLLGLAFTRIYPAAGFDFAGQAAVAACGALIVWLLVFGLTGFFLRYAGRPSSRVRYLSDASYWLYLSHLPLTIALPALFKPLPLNAFGKFALVCLATLAITLVLYDLLIRPTAVGALLNGRRYPRALGVLWARPKRLSENRASGVGSGG
jgi:glucans biosynthesis protein C